MYRGLSSFLAVLLAFCSATSETEASGEPYRPQFHFSAKRNWLNDPNGLVYHDGEYHLFFQYNPNGIQSANKSWGHAVSRDLVRWEELAMAIPFQNGIEIWSGNAVVDWNNTSGFGVNGQPPLVALYTGFNTSNGVQDQRVAYSTDRGRTWTTYSGNPVLTPNNEEFRDPDIFWHAETGKWIMTISLTGQKKVRFYSSPDLKSWTALSEFGRQGAPSGVWECPDLFPLGIEGREGSRKWVLTVSVGNGGPNDDGWGTQYFIGEFDGTNFIDDLTAAGPPPLPPGELIADFEGTTFAGWTKTGSSFGTGPVAGATGDQRTVTGYRGERLANSFAGGDGPTGTLTSPGFPISRDYLNFLIGGGNHPGQTCINLRVNGSVVRTATGADSEFLQWKNWDVSEFEGMEAVIEIVDSATGGWGHVLADHILLADEQVPASADPARWVEHGPDNYASITFSDIPESDGRTTAIGWMASNNYIFGPMPTTPWRGNMTVAREYVLRETPQGLRLAQEPVAELRSLRGRHLSHAQGSIAEVNAWLATQDVPKLMECVVDLEVPEGEAASLAVGTAGEKTTVTWDRAASQLLLDRTQSGVSSFSGNFAKVYKGPVVMSGKRMKLKVLVDAGSIEVFGAEGTSALTGMIFPAGATKGLQFAGSANVIVHSLKVWELGSIHPGQPTELLAQWDFDEASPGSYADASGKGHTMVASDSVGIPAPAVTAGAIGNGMEIRRNDSNGQVCRLTVPAANPLMPDSFTLSYRFNPKANDNAKLTQLRWETPAGLGWGTEILANRVANFFVFDSDSANDVQSSAQLPFEAFNSSGNTSDNLDNDPTWHHLAATYDAMTGVLTLFLDGVKSQKLTTGLLGAPRYGTAGSGGGIQTGGGLTIYDDLRIYGKVLADSQVDFLRLNPGQPLPSEGGGPPVTPVTGIEQHGSSSFVRWPAGTGLALWRSTDLGSWTKVEGSEYLTAYSIVTATAQRVFFKLDAP